ncbi:Gfo/Idh/MocA family protein [Jeotgalibacillus soli]|uniref:NADH-dependent dehydrogenase n=1 Tax=Jeotgalibacillus soli TaxID=889306 RepID=A0A0C2W132_9BACL|nr:Gfo/Idh/MocA family oxidoreductase [Jeotgalibacillus soli]KIL49858.1 NADH-dependent dehydrogenase [Jeotgalibacillus soli]
MNIGIMSFAHMHAYSYAQCLLQLKQENVNLISIWDDNSVRGKEASEQFNAAFYNSFEEFFRSGLDAVIICSENVHHHDQVIAAAKAGLHIMCEKPLSLSTEEAENMIRTCNDQQVILQTAFPVRFAAPIRRLKEAVEAGEAGEIVAIRTTNRGQNPGGWFADPALSGGGALLDHTVHMADIMRWITGSEVKEVHAEWGTQFGSDGIDDMGLLTLIFEDGIIASHDASWSRPSGFPSWGDVTIEVIGTKKTLYADGFGERGHVYRKSGRAYEHVVSGEDMDMGLIRDFVDTVKEGRSPSITGEDGLRAAEIAFAAYEGVTILNKR